MNMYVLLLLLFVLDVWMFVGGVPQRRNQDVIIREIPISGSGLDQIISSLGGKNVDIAIIEEQRPQSQRNQQPQYQQPQYQQPQYQQPQYQYASNIRPVATKNTPQIDIIEVYSNQSPNQPGSYAPVNSFGNYRPQNYPAPQLYPSSHPSEYGRYPYPQPQRSGGGRDPYPPPPPYPGHSHQYDRPRGPPHRHHPFPGPPHQHNPPPEPPYEPDSPPEPSHHHDSSEESAHHHDPSRGPPHDRFPRPEPAHHHDPPPGPPHDRFPPPEPSRHHDRTRPNKHRHPPESKPEINENDSENYDELDLPYFGSTKHPQDILYPGPVSEKTKSTTKRYSKFDDDYDDDDSDEIDGYVGDFPVVLLKKNEIRK